MKQITNPLKGDYQKKDPQLKGCRMRNLEQGWIKGFVSGVMKSIPPVIDVKAEKKES